MEIRRRQLLGWSLAASAAWPAAVLAAPELRQVNVALTARYSLYHLPLVLADRLGFFRQRGLQVNLSSYDSGAAGVGSVLQGRADVLAGAFEHLFELQRQGHFFQAFVQMANTPMISLGVSTMRAAPKSWQDLRGARLGISALESSTHWMSSQWLLRQGISPQEVRFVEVGTSATALGALWEGQIDALCNPDPMIHWLEQRGELRLIAEARTPAGTRQLAGGPLPGGCLMAREEFLQRNPQLIAALTDGLLSALRWLHTAGPTDLFKTVPVAPWLSDRAVYLGALEKLRDGYARDGLIQEEAVFNAWRMHARLAAQAPSSRNLLARTYTNLFAAQAARRMQG